MLKASLKSYFADTDGAAAIEYGLLLALLSLAILGALTALGNATSDTFQNIADVTAVPAAP